MSHTLKQQREFSSRYFLCSLESRSCGRSTEKQVLSGAEPFTHHEQGQLCPESAQDWSRPAGLCQAACFITRHQFRPIVWLHKARLVCKRRESTENGISSSLLTSLGPGARLGPGKPLKASTQDVSAQLGWQSPSDVFQGLWKCTKTWKTSIPFTRHALLRAWTPPDRTYCLV